MVSTGKLFGQLIQCHMLIVCIDIIRDLQESCILAFLLISEFFDLIDCHDQGFYRSFDDIASMPTPQ